MKLLKNALGLLVMLTLLCSLTACMSATEKYTAGTHSAEAEGYGGPVKVEVTVDKEKITDVKLTGADETPSIGGKALETLPAAIREKGESFDAVAGATVTSEAVRKALKDALGKAGTK